MLVKGYFYNYSFGCDEDGFVAEINASKEDIAKYVDIARCLYQECDEIYDYDFPCDTDDFIAQADDTCFNYKEYLGFVLDEFEVDWNWYNIPCDLEICIN